MSLRLGYRGAQKATGLAIVLVVLLGLYTLHSNSDTHFSSLKFPWTRKVDTCTPQAYGNGKWVYRPRTNATIMTAPEDAHAFAGFSRCASSREYNWHLAADKPEQYERFPGAQSWEWVPGRGCETMAPLDPASLVRLLVEDGGWYLVGDSVTENHFFSLSCVLHPHVVATPDYVANPHFDRAWPQHLHLSPDSPLLPYLHLPPTFNISTTPLVTFRRIDILLSKAELLDIHTAIQTAPLNDSSLFGDEAVWTLPLDEYLNEFLAPTSGYATMVVSTAGHWTTRLLTHVAPPGINGVLGLFDHAMQHWAKRVQDGLSASASSAAAIAGSRMRGTKKRRAVIRAYLPGHEDCHATREPWTEVKPFTWGWYNWAHIWEFNEVFERAVSPYPDIHYLGIDRPARLRPDAHATGDCLHIMSGAGVLEGWSHYIHHFVSTSAAAASA